jgi:hypothetical protein
MQARGGGGGGASGAVAALVQQAQAQNEQFQKLLQVITQLQQENAQAVQAAGQAGGMAATQVANQVATAMGRIQEEERRGEERAEERQFSEEMTRLNAKLQQDAQREAQSMAVAIQGQREAIARFTDQWLSRRNDMQEAIAAYGARTDEMLAAGFFDSKQGRQELKQRLHLIEMMQANSDDHFDDRHLSAAYQLHNQNLQRLAEGGEAMDLSRMQVDPLMLPMPETQDGGRRVAGPEEVSPQKMFEMKLYGGYPARGVVFNDEENFGLPAGYSPRMADAETMLEALSRDDMYRFASDQSIRRQLTRKNQELLVQSMDRLEPLKEQYENFNQVFNGMAPAAVDAAIQEFMAEPNPHKFDDVGRHLVSLSVKHMFGGGTRGEQMALRAMETFDGKRELTTPEQAFVAMAMESAAFNVKTHLLTEIMGAEGAEGTVATRLVQQMSQQLGEKGMAQALGVSPDAVGLVDAQRVMTNRITEAYTFANRLHQGLWNQSVLEQFRGNLRKFTRLADLFAFKTVQEAEGTQRRVMQLMGQDEALSQMEQDIKGTSPEDLESLAERRDETAVQEDLNMLDAMIQLSEQIGPDTLTGVVTMATAGQAAQETPNLRSYLDQTYVERQRSGYVKSAAERSRFNYDRQQRARRQAQQQKQQQPTMQESAQERGAVGVVTEQVPALMSLGVREFGRSAERAMAGVAQIYGGRPAAEGFVRGQEAAKKGAAVGLTRMFGARPPNLSPEERERFLRGEERAIGE